MKSKVLATLAATVLAAPAWAQTGISFYGIADAAIVNIDNIGGLSRNSMETGYLQSSRLGLRGNKDLNSDVSAVLTLETGFNTDNGASTSSSTFFNRQAFVGLSSKSLGRLTAGRQYTTIYDQLILVASAPAFGVSGGALDGIPSTGSAASRFDNTLGGTRIDNSLKYNSPNVGNWRFDAMYGLGEVGGSSSAKQFLSVGTNYTEGPVRVGLAHQVKNCEAVTGCTATQANDSVTAIGGGYDFGGFKLSSIYTTQKNAKNLKGVDADVWHAMVQKPIGPWLLAAGYQKLNDKSTANQDATQYNLSALYSLNTDATLYLAWSSQSVSNGGKAGMALTTSDNSKQRVLAAGLRYTF